MIRRSTCTSSHRSRRSSSGLIPANNPNAHAARSRSGNAPSNARASPALNDGIAFASVRAAGHVIPSSARASTQP